MPIHRGSSYLRESPKIPALGISADEFHVGQIPRLGDNTPFRSLGKIMQSRSDLWPGTYSGQERRPLKLRRSLE